MLGLRPRELQDYGERLVPRENEPWEFADHSARYAFVQNLVDDNKYILEIGCGAGYGLRKLSESKAIKGIGIDVSREAISYAKKHSSSQLHLEFAVMDATKLAFRDNVLDTVFSLEVIEHVEDYQEFVKESCRVLKLGGKYIISTPNKDPSARFISCPFHVREFTKGELSVILEKHFTGIQIFGKRITNTKFLVEQEKLSKTIRNQSLRLVLTFFPHVRFIAKHLPRYLKRIVTGYPNVTLKLEDFEITSDLCDVSNLIAVASKQHII